MKKRILALLMCATMVFGLVACGGGSSDDGAADNGGAPETIKVGLVTDVGGVNDLHGKVYREQQLILVSKLNT